MGEDCEEDVPLCHGHRISKAVAWLEERVDNLKCDNVALRDRIRLLEAERYQKVKEIKNLLFEAAGMQSKIDGMAQQNDGLMKSHAELSAEFRRHARKTVAKKKPAVGYLPVKSVRRKKS